VRYANGCSPTDLWTTYFTSSKYVNELINTYGKDSFIYEIRKLFNNKQKARLWEHKVLKRISAVSRSDFLNKTDNISICPSACKSMLGKHQSDKQKMIVFEIGKANLGRKASDVTKKKISKALLNNKYRFGKKDSVESRLKKSKAKLGKPSNAIGNYQPRCSCSRCHKEMTSGTIKRHFEFHH
jgi:hypothetical protein